jgi:membrane protein
MAWDGLAGFDRCEAILFSRSTAKAVKAHAPLLSPALLRQALARYLDQDMGTYASALAFQAFFSIFPFLLFLVALLAFLDVPQFFDWLRLQASMLVPQQALDPVMRVIEQVRRPNSTLLSFGVAAAWWGASAGVRSTMTALNVTCQAPESRPAWLRILLSLLYTVALAVLLIAAALLFSIGPEAAHWLVRELRVDWKLAQLWTWLRLPLWLALLALTVTLVYWAAPSCRRPLRHLFPGAIFAVLAWMAASAAFGYYLANFANYSALYGSIGTIIGLLLYFSLSSAVLLFGAEINAVLAAQERAFKTPLQATGVLLKEEAR